MKYLDQVCGLRLKTAVKMIAIIGMVASLAGFSIAVNRMVQTSARHNNSTDAQTQTLTSEGYFEGNQEDETSGATSFHKEDTTVLPDVVDLEDSTEDIEDVVHTENLQEISGSEDVVSRSRRDVDKTSTTEVPLVAGTDTSAKVQSTSSENVGLLDYENDDNEASQSSVTKRPKPTTTTPKPEFVSSSTNTSPTTMTTTMKKTEEVTSTATEKPVDHVPELPESKEDENIPASSGDESHQVDYQETDNEHLEDEEVSEETGIEIMVESDYETPDSSANEDISTDEDNGETDNDEDDAVSSPGRASQVVTGLGAPICLLGFLANAILLHAAKKAEKKLLMFWFVWIVFLYMYQIFAMIINLCDLSPYIFANLMLFLWSAGVGYVVLSYRKQLTDPSSYSLKTVEMNGYAMDKGYMELDNKGASAGGDNNV